MANRFVPLFFFSLIIFSVSPVWADNTAGLKSAVVTGANYILDGDILYRTADTGRVKLYERVAAISVDDSTLYYIRSTDDKWIAGFINNSAVNGTEYDIPGRYEKLYKFSGYQKVFYFLADPFVDNIDKPKDCPLFVRFNPDQSACNSIVNVSDFLLINGKSVIIRENILDYNGMEIPLSMNGRLKISSEINSRIITVSGEDGTEIIDILAAKSIYQYRDGVIPDMPVEYNLILEFKDQIAHKENQTAGDSSIYYVVLIDGADENRTVTGTGETEKILYSKLDTGRYHVIKPERWELDQGKGRYVRMNNIYQPQELKIYLPENRILKVKIEFDGSTYRVGQSVQYK